MSDRQKTLVAALGAFDHVCSCDMSCFADSVSWVDWATEFMDGLKPEIEKTIEVHDARGLSVSIEVVWDECAGSLLRRVLREVIVDSTRSVQLAAGESGKALIALSFVENGGALVDVKLESLVDKLIENDLYDEGTYTELAQCFASCADKLSAFERTRRT